MYDIVTKVVNSKAFEVSVAKGKFKSLRTIYRTFLFLQIDINDSL